MVDNTFFHEWVVLGQHREFAQHPRRLPHDQPDKSQCNTEIVQIQRYLVGIMLGEYHLEEIQPVSEYQKYGHKSYRAPVPFRAAFHQDQQRSHEIDDEIQVEDPLVGALKTGLEIDRFLGNIRIPDQHKLVEPEIGPEYGKGELELSEVMQVLLVDVFQVSPVLQINDENGHQRNAGNKGAGKGIPAIHC